MITPYLQVRSDCLLYYNLNDYRPPKNLVPIVKPAYSGKVTEGAKKRIQKAIDILIQKCPTRMKFNPVTQKYFPFRLSFVTLTFSTKKLLDTREVYRTMLKPLLRKLRKGNQFSYVWKAEFQSNIDYQGKHKENGGQLHYHLASNQVIPWNELRREWNNLQRKNGHLKEYGLKHGHYNPNSTDIHATRKIRNLGAYLGKYMCKEDKMEGKEGTEYEGKKVDGKVWDCSVDLKRNRFSFELSGHTGDKIRKAVDAGKVQQINLEHCTIFKTKEPLSFLSPYLLKDYWAWRDNIVKTPTKIIEMKEKNVSLSEQIELSAEKVYQLQKQYFLQQKQIKAYKLTGDEDNARYLNNVAFKVLRDLKEERKNLKELRKKKIELRTLFN